MRLDITYERGHLVLRTYVKQAAFPLGTFRLSFGQELINLDGGFLGHIDGVRGLKTLGKLGDPSIIEIANSRNEGDCRVSIRYHRCSDVG